MKNGERLRMKEHGVKQTSFVFALWVVKLAKELQGDKVFVFST